MNDRFYAPGTPVKNLDKGSKYHGQYGHVKRATFCGYYLIEHDKGEVEVHWTDLRIAQSREAS